MCLGLIIAQLVNIACRPLERKANMRYHIFKMYKIFATTTTTCWWRSFQTISSLQSYVCLSSLTCDSGVKDTCTAIHNRNYYYYYGNYYYHCYSYYCYYYCHHHYCSLLLLLVSLCLHGFLSRAAVSLTKPKHEH